MLNLRDFVIGRCSGCGKLLGELLCSDASAVPLLLGGGKLLVRQSTANGAVVDASRSLEAFAARAIAAASLAVPIAAGLASMPSI